MSSLLHLASLRCARRLPIRNIQNYYGVSSLMNAAVAPRINYFIPKTIGVEPKSDSKVNLYDLKVPDNFDLIYRFDDAMIRVTSFVAAFYSLLIAVGAYNYFNYENNQTENKTDSTARDEEVIEVIEINESNLEVNEVYDFLTKIGMSFQERLSSPDPGMSLALSVVILFIFLYARSRIVLRSYRSGNDYVTSITKMFGFGVKIVRHKSQEVIFFPNRWFYHHELHGQRILLFPERFISKKEESLMCSGMSVPEETTSEE